MRFGTRLQNFVQRYEKNLQYAMLFSIYIRIIADSKRYDAIGARCCHDCRVVQPCRLAKD